MAKLIGTAGHVDHGKTTLIQALTGIDADRLPEEKRRGMTIDIGFAYVDLPIHGRVSIVDVPGHEKFVTNMLVGALGIDLALLCVAADEGVMPQTREHVQILDLLPVDQLVVAMTRADLADAETREFCREDIAQLLEATRFKNAPVIEVSSATREGLPDLLACLDSNLEGGAEKHAGPWYLPIDRAFSMKGHGCVVTGTLAQGAVELGERGVIIPGGLEARVRTIHCHGHASERAEAGQRTALNLSGVKLEQLHRGQAIGEVGALFETDVIDAEVRWVGNPKHGLRIRLAIGADDAIGRVFLNDEQPTIAQLRLESKVACALNQPLIIRRYSPPDLLGGGRAVIPQATLRRKSETPPTKNKESTDELAILGVLAGQANGLPTEEICRLLGKTPQALGTALETLSMNGNVRGFGGLWFDSGTFTTSSERLLRALDELHQQMPLVAFQPREKVVARAGFSWVGKPLDRIVAVLAAEGKLAANGTAVKASGFQIKLTDKQQTFLDRVVAALHVDPVSTPTSIELAKTLVAPVQAIDEILRLGIQAGKVVSLADGVWYTQAQLESIKEATVERFTVSPFTASEFRDFFNTTRKYAIPLLEHFDAVRFTTRLGDKRMINSRR